MRELNHFEKAFHALSWTELERAQSLFESGRKARAQEALTEALTASVSLPRWFTDEDWTTQFNQLHKDLYRGV